MAKAKIIDVIKEETFFNPDVALIESLRHVVNPSYQQLEDIYTLYKRYINPGASQPCSNCVTGNNSIVSYFWAVNGLDTNNLIKK